MNNHYATISENRQIGSRYYLLTLSWRNASTLFFPGQFINIKIGNTTAPLLRRPFSIFSAERETLSILYAVVGKGTEILSTMKNGDKLDCLGPLGNGYFDHYTPSPSDSIILIGGGTGAASLFYCAQWLYTKHIHFTVLLGFRSQDDVLCLDLWKQLGTTPIITTEDGSIGTRGVITEQLSTNLSPQSHILACGPLPLLAALQSFCSAATILASFEGSFGCGTGMCSGCIIPTQEDDGWTYKKICVDGPIFDLNTILFKGSNLCSQHS